MDINIRQAQSQDTNDVIELLRQVNDIHAEGRPDLFKKGMTKYTSEELVSIFENPETPVFVAIDSDSRVLGYCFCVIQEEDGSHNLQPHRTLYIDDLCVDGSCRGLHIGKQLFDYVKQYAQARESDNITLNVWSCNPSAMRFYQNIGLIPYKIGMELKL